MWKRMMKRTSWAVCLATVLSLTGLSQCTYPWSDLRSTEPPSAVLTSTPMERATWPAMTAPVFPSPMFTPAPEGLSKCILDSKFCEPPCWEGIIPGTTSKQEALRLLAESDFCIPNTIRQLSVDEHRQAIRWLDKGVVGYEADHLTYIGYGHKILIRDNTVQWITLLLNTRACRLTAEMVVEQYGDPEAVLYSSASSGGAMSLRGSELDLLYPSQGVLFAVLGTNPPSRNALVGVVDYVIPESVDTFLSKGGWEAWTGYLVEWQGFASE